MPQKRSHTVSLVRFAACAVSLSLGASAAYTVRPGDTLSGIASRLGVKVADLARANAIGDPDHVEAGRALDVPGSSIAAAGAVTAPAAAHLVVRGDNLTTIARRYGVSVDALATANKMSSSGILRSGVRLSIPSASVGAGTSSYPSRLRRSPERLALVPSFQKWAAANGIPGDLLMATTYLESGWQNSVVSSVGAIGIGQLMPSTVRYIRGDLIGVPNLDPRIPDHNIRMSARYLRFLLGHTDGDVRMALASYYQGPGSVRSIGLYDDTVQYVESVLSLRASFR